MHQKKAGLPARPAKTESSRTLPRSSPRRPAHASTRPLLALATAGLLLAAPAASAQGTGTLLPGALPPGAVAGCTGAADEVRLRVEVRDVRKASGVMTITLYPDDPGDFLARRGKIARLRVPVTVPETDACMVAPGPGGYAIAVYHDVNGNSDFDRTIVGLPKEPFGFSNDASTSRGLPRFQEVRFEAAAGDTRVPITLRH